MYTEGIEVKCKDEDLNAKLYNNRASAHYHLGKVSFLLYLLNALSTLHVVSYPTFYCLFCIFALLRKDTPGIPIQLSLLAHHVIRVKSYVLLSSLGYADDLVKA